MSEMKRHLSKLCSVILEGEDALYPQASNDHYCCRYHMDLKFCRDSTNPVFRAMKKHYRFLKNCINKLKKKYLDPKMIPSNNSKS